MKHGKNVFKAGKLIKIDLEYESVIRSIKIHGDFFLYPEDGIEKLQEKLVGTGIDRQKIKERIDQIVNELGLEPFGFTSEELAEAIIGACKWTP